ncbi:hypothetical protein Dsin_002640 [Dipteronia sinensis]|uniref:Uncharacterized protein n=1 Tax=Dipteronia sinensis TaxID=43782 RepID=A0AAE0B7I1_9ROSI|nr:hypothetical protein Dsin_002640 [Dipteronia sinensis]
MEATSSSTSKRNINGGIIKFKNWKCSCGIKADRGKCNLYWFWEPNDEEFNLSEYTENITQRYDGRDRYDGRATLLLEQEMEEVKARL